MAARAVTLDGASPSPLGRRRRDDDSVDTEPRQGQEDDVDCTRERRVTPRVTPLDLTVDVDSSSQYASAFQKRDGADNGLPHGATCHKIRCRDSDDRE